MTAKPNTKLILLALWLMVFSASSQVIIISPILPRIGEAFTVADSWLGLLVTVYAAMLSIFALIMGPISDKVGRRRILLYGTGFTAGALVLHSFADTFVSLLVLRGIAGAGGGMLSGAAVSYVGDYFPYERRGWANGWIMSGIAFGQIIGIPLGTLLADWFDFRAPFLLFALTMGVAWLLIWFFVPQPDVALNTHRLSIPGALRNYWHLLRTSDIAIATGVYFLMFFGVGLYVIFMPQWLEEDLGISSGVIASMFLVGGIANVITGPIAGWLSDSVGRKPLIIFSCLGLAVVMATTTYAISSPWVAYVFFALAMVMVAMRISPLQSLISALVSSERRGVLMSMTVALGQVGIGIGAAVAGPLYTRFGFMSNTMLGAAAMVGMALLVMIGLPEPSEDPTTGVRNVPETSTPEAVSS